MEVNGGPVVKRKLLERLGNENEDKTKTQMTQSSNQYSENETMIWRQNILNQFNRVSSSCLRSHFVISLLNIIKEKASLTKNLFYKVEKLKTMKKENEKEKKKSDYLLSFKNSSFSFALKLSTDLFSLIGLGSSFQT